MLTMARPPSDPTSLAQYLVLVDAQRTLAECTEESPRQETGLTLARH